ncbi:unnamed protein product [Zymoseptoria tritici ST99CH_1A5]|uniref:UBZ4-type domain-containing protein n=1 Tax=Zymoseptoria tritici ST99CH_1A5 TaxID=1276529 RepID=A0A1Y6L4Z8_ZYMTR|nr:unnamed protein product [Zymoseptoria tritici ST99CH_1A5]
MNRPRNHQQRPSRDQQRGGRRGPSSSSGVSVPTVQQVRPGAAVSIVLKQDQPTGREVQGTMAAANYARSQQLPTTNTTAWPGLREISGDDHLNGPPNRTLADFLPTSTELESQPETAAATFATATAKCPICNIFEGDEIAVSRHVEDHFT